MELHAKEISVFHYRRVGGGVFRGGNRVRGDGREVGVRVVNERTRIDAIQQPGVPYLCDSIPPYVRNLKIARTKPLTASGDDSQPRNFRSFAASGQHPL